MELFVIGRRLPLKLNIIGVVYNTKRAVIFSFLNIKTNLQNMVMKMILKRNIASDGNMNRERIDTPLILPISRITDENPYVKTFWFDFALQSEPGQFVMLWIPGVDQKPFSIGYDTGDSFGLTIFAVGPLSKRLFELKAGDRVGITGPYGKPFSVLPNTHYITVAGGYGAGPLGVLAERLASVNSTVDFCVGARSADLLLFEERISKLPHVKVHVSTNDGSKGQRGFVTEMLEELLLGYGFPSSDEEGTGAVDEARSTSPNLSLSKERKGHGIRPSVLVATCGPEMMEKRVLDICNQYNVPCEISIERYIKCGFGVCGQCCVDDSGIAMCTNGPVVSREVANSITEFGKYHRDKSGTRVNYE